MEELLLEYIQTKKETVILLEKIKDKIAQFESEIKGLSRRSIASKAKLKEEINHLENEKSIISSWISNLEYSIRWLSSGRRPGSLRGIERRAAYEREKPFDPIIMQRYFRSNQPEYPWDTRISHESLLSIDEREVLEYVLDRLTELEREIYILSRGRCKSQYEIAEMLYLSRNTIKTILKRAERKIRIALAEYKEMNM